MSAKNVANMCACPWNEGLQGASLTLLWMPTRLSFVQSVASWTKNPCWYVLKLKYFEYTFAAVVSKQIKVVAAEMLQCALIMLM